MLRMNGMARATVALGKANATVRSLTGGRLEWIVPGAVQRLSFSAPRALARQKGSLFLQRECLALVQRRGIGHSIAALRGGAGAGRGSKVQLLTGLEEELVLYESPQGFWIFLTWLLMLQIGAATAGVLLFMTPLGEGPRKALRAWQLARVQQQIEAGTYMPTPSSPSLATEASDSALPSIEATERGNERESEAREEEQTRAERKAKNSAENSAEKNREKKTEKKEKSFALRLLQDNGHIVALASIGFAAVALIAARKILRGQLSRIALTPQHTLLVETKSLIGRTRSNEISPYHIASTFHMVDGQFWFWLLHNNFGSEQVRPGKYLILQQSQLPPASQRLLTKFLAQQPIEQRDIDACLPEDFHAGYLHR